MNYLYNKVEVKVTKETIKDIYIKMCSNLNYYDRYVQNHISMMFVESHRACQPKSK